MIGTDEMSSSGMDISESFRAEDLSKTDFFDFVTAPDMGIGIGVGVSLHTHHHHHHHHHERTSTSHDVGGGGGGGGGSGVSVGNSDIDGRLSDGGTNGNSGDPTLHAYDQFWNTDKEHSRLESTIFEDLDRYCWQQHQQQLQPPSQTHAPALTSPTSPTPHQHLGSSSVNSSSSANNAPGNNTTGVESGSSSGSISISQPSSAGTSSSIDNTDGQIYTITVLNGNEPWLKREPDTNQLPSSLDLDSLLGTFPGYIKSEYPYDDSGFSTDGTKDNSDGSGISIPQLTTHHSLSSGVGSGPTGGPSLPSLVTALSVASSSAGIGGITTNLQQQFAQFQNNNNDWHMADNNAEQNSAESLLRSALQGKGYSKGLQMSNGIALLPASPIVKDDDMRRILFSSETDTLGFADSTLNAVQIFDDTQNSAHAPHAVIQQHTTSNGPPSSSNTSTSTTGPSAASIIVDDMFLSLESAFSDDFEKIKRIANEVQHFCTSAPAVTDFPGNDVLMQISATAAGLQQLHSPATTPTGATTSGIQHIQQVTHPPPPPQPLKPEVTTSTATRISAGPPIGTKTTKKYKRSTSGTSASTTHNNNTNNNNNPNVLNHNNNNSNNKSTNGSGSSTNNNNNGPAGSNSSNANSNSPTHCNGQRKERSLHYCSICSKGFKDKYSVNVHIRTHTGEKPFACSLCGKSFRQKAHLAKHYQTHMAQKSNGNLVKSSSSTSKHHRGGGGGGATIAGAGGNMGLAGGGGNGPTIAVTPGIVPQHRQLGMVSSSTAAIASVVSSNGPTTTMSPTNAIIANR